LQDNLNARGGHTQEPTSQIFLWDWQCGTCLQETPIPRSQNFSMILAPTQAAAGISQITHNVLGGGLNDPTLDGNTNEGGCHIQLSFDKSGTLFMVLESSPLKIGGGYRVTLWSCTK